MKSSAQLTKTKKTKKTTTNTTSSTGNKTHKKTSKKSPAPGHQQDELKPMATSGTVTSSSTLSLATNNCAECYACGKTIKERYLLKALDQLWHEDCLKCSCCDCRLGEVGSTLYTKANLVLCKRDYLRLFGATGLCSACDKTIPAFEMVMRAKGNVYHLECFACQQCNHRFCVGDRFYLYENKILCEYDYEERMVFASLPQTMAAMDHVKRQTANAHELMVSSSNTSMVSNMLADGTASDCASSGYGSHSESPYTEHR